ncbi:MAG: bile acid:sodium symporter family protein [Bacteroidetes bacterium]|nr:bile acid:sodium symporter family protein [Bacteroidota bacterium]
MFRFSLILSLVFLLVSIPFLWINSIEIAGVCLILVWWVLALGFRLRAELMPYSFPIAILGVVTLALFFPKPFQEVAGFSLAGLINPLIQLIMFGMGATLSWKDFAAVAKSPKSVILGIGLQFTIMPLVGFGLAKLSGLPPEVAAGIILVGCSPSGTASNVMAFLARANVALSVTLTAIITLMAPFITPVLMKSLAGQFIEIDLVKMMWDIVKIILIPVGAGLFANQLVKKNSMILGNILPFVSMVGIALIILVITAAGRDSLLQIGPILIGWVLIHNVLGYGIAYGLSKVLGFQEQDARTLAIEVGMQNAGLASGLANLLGKITTLGLAPAVFGPLQNITGSILAAYWGRKKKEV